MGGFQNTPLALAGQSRREKNVGGTAKNGGKREGQIL